MHYKCTVIQPKFTYSKNKNSALSDETLWIEIINCHFRWSFLVPPQRQEPKYVVPHFLAVFWDILSAPIERNLNQL